MREVIFEFEDLWMAYLDCTKNKKTSNDYLEYELTKGKEDLFLLLEEINEKKYQVGNSYCFVSTRPKLREIFASSFRDRIVHHLLVMILEPHFEKRFIKNVFSCRTGKGALLGIQTIFKDLQKCDSNYFYLQCDIKSFFMSIDKDLLFQLINQHLRYKNFKNYLLLRYITKEIIYNNPIHGVEKRGDLSLFSQIPYGKSLFHLEGKNCGLPIGNLTSQFFANVYLHELDRYIKKELKTQYYYRFVDDFILLGTKEELREKKRSIELFLFEKLALELSVLKTKFFPINYDIDFIGYIIRDTQYLLPRKRNINIFKQEIFYEKISNKKELQHTFSSINSHIGYLQTSKTYDLRKKYLSKLNHIIFSVPDECHKIINDETVYTLLSVTNKKPMKKYAEIQKKYPGYVLIIQIGCFYKIFDSQAIFLSEQLGLKLTIFNPKTSGERIMCGFHIKSRAKYKELIMQKQINTLFLKQLKQNDEIIREIEEICEFQKPLIQPVYTQAKVNEIKQEYYQSYFEHKKISSGDFFIDERESRFIQDFKNTDFSKKTMYEIIEYIINWKKIFS